MSTNTKFMFDTEFGGAAGNGSAAKNQPVLYTEADATLMKTEAYEEGVRAGQAQAEAGVESSMAALIENLGSQLGQMMQGQGEQLTQVKQEAASLAFAIAGKIAPALLQVAPQAEVTRMIEDCLSDLPEEPRVVVRTSEHVTETLMPKVEQISAKAGFPGSIIMLPDPDMQPGDCRIEWADGGVERSLEDIQKRLSGLLERFIQAGNQSDMNDVGNDHAE
ncbi:MAG: FliH/SctL family protein [Proteobacteria bacterium]|nr:FliH/SctL family protein [Pseudomonadota bacterium]